MRLFLIVFVASLFVCDLYGKPPEEFLQSWIVTEVTGKGELGTVQEFEQGLRLLVLDNGKNPVIIGWIRDDNHYVLRYKIKGGTHEAAFTHLLGGTGVKKEDIGKVSSIDYISDGKSKLSPVEAVSIIGLANEALAESGVETTIVKNEKEKELKVIQKKENAKAEKQKTEEQMQAFTGIWAIVNRDDIKDIYIVKLKSEAGPYGIRTLEQTNEFIKSDTFPLSLLSQQNKVYRISMEYSRLEIELETPSEFLKESTVLKVINGGNSVEALKGPIFGTRSVIERAGEKLLVHIDGCDKQLILTRISEDEARQLKESYQAAAKEYDEKKEGAARKENDNRNRNGERRYNLGLLASRIWDKYHRPEGLVLETVQKIIDNDEIKTDEELILYLNKQGMEFKPYYGKQLDEVKIILDRHKIIPLPSDLE